MRILLMLVPISLLLLGIAIAAFVWAVRRGQFDDLDTPPLDILADEEDEVPDARSDRLARDSSSPRRRRSSAFALDESKTLGTRLRGDGADRPGSPGATTPPQRDRGPERRDAG